MGFRSEIGYFVRRFRFGEATRKERKYNLSKQASNKIKLLPRIFEKKNILIQMNSNIRVISDRFSQFTVGYFSKIIRLNYINL